jgi:hypothetical protein
LRAHNDLPALHHIICNFEVADYQLVPIVEWLGAQPYQIVGPRAARSSHLSLIVVFAGLMDLPHMDKAE